MSQYRTDMIAQLAHELSIAPARHRERNLTGARHAVHLLDPKREYPRSFIVYQITGYHSRQAIDIEMSGSDLISDLVRMIEALTLTHPTSRAGVETMDAAALSARWNISSRTLDRWRSGGLIGMWFETGDQPSEFLFAGDDVAEFEKKYPERVRRASSFRRLYERERRDLARQAMEIVSGEGVSLSEAARRVADRSSRAAETIRLAVQKYRDDPQFADIASPEAALTPEQRLAGEVHNAWQSGIELDGLTEQFDLSRSRIRDLMRMGHAASLAASPFKYVYSPEYDHPDAEALVFADTPCDDQPQAARRPPSGLPPYLAQLYRLPLLTIGQERDYFRRMNYLMHRAERARALIDPGCVTDSEIDHIETLLSRATHFRNLIMQGNLRLVVSVAKKHLRTSARLDLFELVSEGNVALMRAVAAFDVDRGNRFSTYATWTLMRHYGRVLSNECGHQDRYRSGAETFWTIADDDNAVQPSENLEGSEAESVLQDVLDDLNPRERDVLTRRFGLGSGEPQTLREVSDAVNLSRERIRQIERGALDKLRGALGERGLDVAVLSG